MIYSIKKFALINLLFYVFVGQLLAGCIKSDSLKESTNIENSVAFQDSLVFLNNTSNKTFIPPKYIEAEAPSGTIDASVTIHPSVTLNKVSPYLFGTNANTFSGQMVNESELISHIHNLNPGIIRFPGGNISSVYFWNTSKWLPPKDIPKKVFVSKTDTMSSEYWFGINPEPWTISLDNYYNMLTMTGSTGMFTVNYGYARYGTSKDPVAAAAHLAADWVRYDRGRTKYWEIGNESYGFWQAGWKIDRTKNQDNQPEFISGDVYARHFKVFADSMRKAAAEIGVQIKLGGQLIAKPTPNNDNPAEPSWNRLFLTAAGRFTDYYVVHSYYTPYGENNSVQDILNSGMVETKAIESYLRQSFKESGQVQKPIALTEWNIFSEGSKQKVSQIAGMHSVIVLGELIKAKCAMAARWGLLGKYTNGDDFGTISIGDEPDNNKKWNPRPVFYYMYYFRKMIGDVSITSQVTGNPNLIAYASKVSPDVTSIVLVNKSAKESIVGLHVDQTDKSAYNYYYVLCGRKGEEFSRSVFVNGKGPSLPSGGPLDYESLPALRMESKGEIKVKVPKYGVVS